MVLRGSDRGGSLGLKIDALDLDRDGCAELAATEDCDALEDAYDNYRIDWSRVVPKAWLFHAPDQSGSAPERAAASFVRDGDFASWASDLLLLPSGELVLQGTHRGEDPAGPQGLHAWRPDLTVSVDELGLDDRSGRVIQDFDADAVIRPLAEAAAAFAGRTFQSTRPIAGGLGAPARSAPRPRRAHPLGVGTFSGDEGERAEQAYGEADLYEDGLVDRVIGAYNAAGASG